MEPFFEQYPVLLIPIVIVIVEAWNAAKSRVKSWQAKPEKVARP